MSLFLFPDSCLVAAIQRAQEQWMWHTTTLADRLAFRYGPQPTWPDEEGGDSSQDGPPPPSPSPNGRYDDFPLF